MMEKHIKPCTNALVVWDSWTKTMLMCILMAALVGRSMSTKSPPYCPVSCQCLQSSTVTVCENSLLTDVPRDIPPKTIVLDLDGNLLQEINNSSLSPYSSLEVFTAQSNQIGNIGMLAFVNQLQLKVISLRNNQLWTLPKQLFTNNRKLQQVDLSYNLLYYIPQEVLIHLYNLQILNLSFNRIMSAFLGPGIRYCSQLSLLDLTGNDIPKLEARAFEAAEVWDQYMEHVINISSCNLRTIESGALNNIGQITGLVLADNFNIPKQFLNELAAGQLVKLNMENTNFATLTGYFDNARLQKLQELNLARNQLTEIDSKDFYYLENLRVLDLRHNSIGSIKNFNGLSRLEYLDLSENRINKINLTTFDGAHLLRVLYLRHNNLTDLTDEPFSDLFELQSLDISRNRIVSFRITSSLEYLTTLNISHNALANCAFLRKLPNLQYLDMSNNTIEAIVPDTFQPEQLVKFANFSWNQITTIAPFSLNLASLEILDLSHNHISNLAYFGWKPRLKEIYLSHNTFNSVASDTFSGLSLLEVLDLSYCGLQALPKGVFDKLFHLKRLALSGNPMGGFLASPSAQAAFTAMPGLQTLLLKDTGSTQLPLAACVNQTSLRELDLSGNSISSIPSNICSTLINLRLLNLSYNSLQKIDYATLHCMYSLESIDLSHNTFKCSCDYLPSCDWLKRTHLQVINKQDPEFYSCINQDGRSVLDYCDYILQHGCESHTKPLLWALIAGVCVFSIVLLGFGLWRICAGCRHKRKLSRMMDREMEIQREKMLMQTQFASLYYCPKEESL